MGNNSNRLSILQTNKSKKYL